MASPKFSVTTGKKGLIARLEIDGYADPSEDLRTHPPEELLDLWLSTCRGHGVKPQSAPLMSVQPGLINPDQYTVVIAGYVTAPPPKTRNKKQ